LGQRADAAAAIHDRVPDLIATDADRRNNAQSGDDDFTHERGASERWSVIWLGK
jgi:hypothetical protein